MMGGYFSSPSSIIRDFPSFVFKASESQKMIFVVNTSLKMQGGKMAAQVAHAALGVYRVAKKSDQGRKALAKYAREGEKMVVVKGQSAEQLEDLCERAKNKGLFAYVVQDAGRTQVASGSLTVLGLFGCQEDVDELTGTMKLL
uniref:peptidyl-tRNA hydrolase n=1 Tax=Ditylenchus dipsaci TaxID=166011 RepID=A0A915EQZ4_9BILA